MQRRLLLCFLSLIFTSSLIGQDLHFSNYNFAPLYINPAKTGSFFGTVRLGGIYREEARFFINNPFQTQSLYIDSPITRGFSKNHWVGVGLNLYTDTAGDLATANNGMMLSGAYHMGMGKKSKNVLTIGLQYALIQRKVNDPTKAEFEDESGQDINLIEDFSGSYSDFNLGVQYTSQISKNSTLELGAALYHLLGPSFRFNGGSVENKVSQRINVHGSLRMFSSPRLVMEPSLYFSVSSTATNIFAQYNLEYLIKKGGMTSINFGLGYRAGDAIQIMLGSNYKDWKVGLTYDLTTSSASAYDNRFGGIELGAVRIFKWEKKPKVIKTLFCPRL